MSGRPYWEESLFGSRAALYGEDLIKKMGVTKLPIDENLIADFCGYEIMEISVGESPDEIERFSSGMPHLKKIFSLSSAFLLRESNMIVINKEMPVQKKKTGAFHELGHDLCPWHRGLDFACVDTCLDPENHKQAEQEAFDCGASIQMPGSLFLPYVMELNIGENAIRNLAYTFSASLEVTAKRYATVSPGVVAVVVVEPVPPVSLQLIASENRGTSLFPIFQTFHREKKSHWICDKTIGGDPIKEESSYPVRVRYSTNSNGFGSFIPHGTLIPETSPIYQTYATGITWRGELKASDVGLSNWKLPFMAECFTFGSGGDKKAMAFLWRPDKQMSFLKEVL